MNKLILTGLLFLTSAAQALPQNCDTKLSFYQILSGAKEIVFKVPASVRIHTNHPERDFETTTQLDFRVKGYVKVSPPNPPADGVEVTFENHWGSSPYPGYLLATEPTKTQRTFQIPNPINPEYVTAVTAEFDGNVVRILDYFHSASDSTTYLIRPTESCITVESAQIIR